MICMPFSGAGGLGELIAEAICRLGAVPLAAGIGRTYWELLDIADRVERALSTVPTVERPTLDDILAADAAAREAVFSS